MRAHYATATKILMALAYFTRTDSCFSGNYELFMINNKNLLNFATQVTAHLLAAHVILNKILICLPS
jgi:hypothetical protein